MILTGQTSSFDDNLNSFRCSCSLCHILLVGMIIGYIYFLNFEYGIMLRLRKTSEVFLANCKIP